MKLDIHTSQPLKFRLISPSEHSWILANILPNWSQPQIFSVFRFHQREPTGYYWFPDFNKFNYIPIHRSNLQTPLIGFKSAHALALVPSVDLIHLQVPPRTVINLHVQRRPRHHLYTVTCPSPRGHFYDPLTTAIPANWGRRRSLSKRLPPFFVRQSAISARFGSVAAGGQVVNLGHKSFFPWNSINS